MDLRGTGKRIFIVGLDGATLDLLGPWAEEGELPLFQEIFRRGAVGELRSTVPPVTPVAWLSFMTGKSPGRHGVFDLLRPVSADYMEVVPVYGEHCQERTLWEILSNRGRKVGLVNVPMTYPPKRVNGFLISGIPAPANQDRYSYPPSLVPELQEMGWDLTRDASAVTSSYGEKLGYLTELVEMRTEAALYLMTRHEWDLFMVHFLETDQVQHTYWRFMDQDESRHDDLARYGKSILKLFKAVEDSISRMMDLLDEDTILMLVSDHGMGPTGYHVNLNNWLLREGLMVWKGSWPVRVKRLLYSLGIHPSSIYRLFASRLVRRSALGRIRTNLTHIPSSDPGDTSRRHRDVSTRLRDSLCLSVGDIDWSRTKAFASGTTQASFIYLNVRGREPEGVVEQGAEYEELRRLICEGIADVMDPVTGDRPFAHAYRREEVYSGAYVPQAPDIVVICDQPEYNTPLGRLFLTNRVVEPISNATASHRMNGLFAIMGSDIIKPACIVADAEITDIAPTVLYLLGEAIPTDMDGQVLRSCLTKEFLQANPERYAEPGPQPQSFPPERDQDMSPEDLESLRRTLEGLGYL